MLTGIHFLLTYNCNFKCDTCFLYCGPEAKGTFTLAQLRKAFEQIDKIGTIEWAFFEGGEAFLYYPLMLEGLRMARDAGLKTGIVSNSYWATTAEDAELWLRPLAELGLSNLSLSDDSFHYESDQDNPAKQAELAARKLGLAVHMITIEPPRIETAVDDSHRGEPVIGGGAKFRGRAVEKLTQGLPRRDWRELKSCPYENLEHPSRVHVDPFGNVQICQGLCMGNMWQTPLSELARDYNVSTHPICGPLAEGGPKMLAEQLRLDHEETYVDECHFCYALRLGLLERYPQFLAPRQVYGLE